MFVGKEITDDQIQLKLVSYDSYVKNAIRFYKNAFNYVEDSEYACVCIFYVHLAPFVISILAIEVPQSIGI